MSSLSAGSNPAAVLLPPVPLSAVVVAVTVTVVTVVVMAPAAADAEVLPTLADTARVTTMCVAKAHSQAVALRSW